MLQTLGSRYTLLVRAASARTRAPTRKNLKPHARCRFKPFSNIPRRPVSLATCKPLGNAHATPVTTCNFLFRTCDSLAVGRDTQSLHISLFLCFQSSNRTVKQHMTFYFAMPFGGG